MEKSTMNRSILQQQLAQKVGLSLMIGCFSWVALFIRGAFILRDHIGSASYDVVAGPLVLNNISRQETKDGFTASFSFESGLLWYLLVWLLLGVLLAIIFSLKRRRQNESV
jgi:hypothetical protein